jgi:hypothetical protein
LKVIIGSSLLFVACSPPAPNDFEIRLETPSLVKVGKRPFAFSLRQDGRSLEIDEVDIEGQMRHAGMIAQYATAKHAGGGRYSTSAFNFYMAGDWLMTISLQRDGKTQQAQIELDVR